MDTSEALSVLENSACKNATEKVMDAQVSFAQDVRDKMRQMDITELVVPGYGTLTVKHRVAKDHDWYFLGSPVEYRKVSEMKDEDHYEDYVAMGWEKVGVAGGNDLCHHYPGNGYYIHGDFHHWQEAATKAERLAFAKSADAILVAIKEAEARLSSELSALADNLPVSV